MNINPWDARAPVSGLGASSAPPLPSRCPITPSHTSPSTTTTPSAPPQLPPRPSPYPAQRLPHYPTMMPGYRSYGYGSTYGAGSMYGYGRMPGYGFSTPATSQDQNGLVQLAQESSLPAFQSIESIVHAFGSVSMMLESTFHAVHSSFQAVLGVAEHFSQMKLQVSQVFSALSAFRFIKYLYAKFLYLFGLATNNPHFGESVWRNVIGEPGGGSLSEQDIKQPVRWPIIMYIGLVFAAPYIIWKLVSSILPEDAGASKDASWKEGVGEHFLAKVLYLFETTREGELSIAKGQTIRLAPKHLQPRVRGWLLASYEGSSGLVPANYIKILGKTTGVVQPDIVQQTQGLQEQWEDNI